VAHATKNRQTILTDANKVKPLAKRSKSDRYESKSLVLIPLYNRQAI
jgi:hypothetical protein